MKNAVYFYRIITDLSTNFAPCWDDGILTLTCCKRDMRRMIGRRYESKECSESNPIWISGVNGSNQGESANRIRYIARISIAEKYVDYFSKTEYRNRRDCIYDINKFALESDEIKGRIYTANYKAEKTHNTEELQKKDWDVSHGSKECYALISNYFRFLNDDESIDYLSKFPEITCKGVGHKPYSTDYGVNETDKNYVNQDIISYFEKLCAAGKNCPKTNEDTSKCNKSCNQAV